MSLAEGWVQKVCLPFNLVPLGFRASRADGPKTSTFVCLSKAVNMALLLYGMQLVIVKLQRELAMTDQDHV